MLDRLIRFSLAQRGLVIMLALVVLILGVKKTVETPVDVLPDLTKPTVTLLTEAQGCDFIQSWLCDRHPCSARSCNGDCATHF